MTDTPVATKPPRTAPDGRVVCGVESTAEQSFMAGGRYCSLDPDHVSDPDSPHLSYEMHHVTGHGRDVVWLGPWADGRAWQGEQAQRLQAQWLDRHTDPVYLAKVDAVTAGVPAWWTITTVDEQRRVQKADGTYVVYCAACFCYVRDDATPPPAGALCPGCTRQ